MYKEILVYDKGKCIGTLDVQIEPNSLLSVSDGTDTNGREFYILYVTDMDYGILITKEIYDKINRAIERGDDE